MFTQIVTQRLSTTGSDTRPSHEREQLGMWGEGVNFLPGERLHCPNRISRGNGSEPCKKPIKVNGLAVELPSRTRAVVRVMAIPHCHPGELWITCERRSCRAQLAIRSEPVA